MSVSDIFAGFSLYSDQSASSVSLFDNEDNWNSTHGDNPVGGQDDGQNQTELSRSVPSDGESMSLNSDTLQDFGSVVTLPPGTVWGLLRAAAPLDSASDLDEAGSVNSSLNPSTDGDGTRTILSSQPSGAFIPAPEASQDIFFSPHPQLVSGSARSISTVSTETWSFQDCQSAGVPCIVDGVCGVQDDTGDDNDTVSSDNPPFPNACLSSDGEIALTGKHFFSPGHDTVSFEAVANYLMREAINDSRGGDWYAQFSERDWDQFRYVAKMILNTLLPSPSLALPPLPPEIGVNVGYPPLLECFSSYSAKDILPNSFVCGRCSDVIVGAFTLDCGCPCSTMCTMCWEEHLNGIVPQELSNQLGFVWVDRRICPSCHMIVRDGVPCHALDVAILQIVQNLSTSDPTRSSLRNRYFERLGMWGEEVVRRHEEQRNLDMKRRDQLLAQLIHEEEKQIWDRQRRMEQAVAKSTRIWLFAGQATVALVAATMASIGVNVLNRR